MKYIIVLLAALMVGCSTFEKIGDFVSKNDIFVSAAARQAVGRYIASGDTIEAEEAKARRVIAELEHYSAYLDNDLSTLDGLMDLIKTSIPWDDMSTEDKLLIQDVISIFSVQLSKYQQENKISDDARIAIRDLFETAISAARVYLMR